MSFALVLVFALAGYLVGSFSFSRLFVRIFAPNCDVNKLEAKVEDGESMKMLTYGANAVSLVLGAKLSMVVSLLDLLKIAVPMLILKLLYGAEPYFLFYSSYLYPVGMHDIKLFVDLPGGHIPVGSAGIAQYHCKIVRIKIFQ